MLPLCFVLMPFGRKTLPSGATVDFDAVYEDLIVPAIRAAGLDALRADADGVGDAHAAPIFERMILCDFAVADVTVASANALYELGLRHGIRPGTTALIHAETEGLRGCVAPGAKAYGLGPDGKPADPAGNAEALRALLQAAKNHQAQPVADRPVFQLVEGYGPPEVARLKTDVFRDRARYDEDARERLANARRLGKEAVRQAALELGDLAQLEAGVAIDLMLSHRAVSDWQAMVDLVARMPAPLAHTVMAREQLAFALNRLKRRDEAAQLLTELIRERGPSSETSTLLGRVYKDRWDEARTTGDTVAAADWLVKAIDAYLQGFEADWRDAFPGINAVTLMELNDPPDPRRLELLPLVTYAVKRRIAQGAPDYWDHATLIELAVLRQDEAAAWDAMSDALAAVREKWEPETTARNLAFIRQSRMARGEERDWATEIERALDRAAAR
ncbi:MAG: TRAFs-binding domain-containing protein [Rhodocyclaceae bacterium]